jgi:hypothetical protein
MKMMKNGIIICRLYSDASAPGQSVSASTVQHLSVGDQVYMEAESGPNVEAWGTHFSGFLIVAD